MTIYKIENASRVLRDVIRTRWYPLNIRLGIKVPSAVDSSGLIGAHMKMVCIFICNSEHACIH